ncbi:MAG TPA: IS66 family insertion sequence element accessory protein TnpB [Vulgatibacter sp.]|nr:IS66 family insertion sequence element accessory protein TnpB [Vulgatibacter sp.]
MGRIAKVEQSRIIEEFERSGMTQQAFAERRGIAVSTLRSWIYRARPVEEAAPAAPRLVPVHVVASPAPSGAGTGALLELAIGERIVVRFPAGTDPRYLAELVSAVA